MTSQLSNLSLDATVFEPDTGFRLADILARMAAHDGGEGDARRQKLRALRRLTNEADPVISLLRSRALHQMDVWRDTIQMQIDSVYGPTDPALLRCLQEVRKTKAELTQLFNADSD